MIKSQSLVYLIFLLFVLHTTRYLKVMNIFFMMKSREKLLMHSISKGRAPADSEASIKNSGFTRTGLGVTVLCLHTATGPGRGPCLVSGTWDPVICRCCTLYTLCTVHCTLYTVHCTLYTVHCTPYTLCLACCLWPLRLFVQLFLLILTVKQ